MATRWRPNLTTVKSKLGKNKGYPIYQCGEINYIYPFITRDLEYFFKMPVVEVLLADIFRYLEGKSRPLVEGEAVFRANHIILCEVEDVNSRRIFALCLQSSALKCSPHEVKLSLGSPGASTLQWICVCSCKAGQSGYCKHVVAALLYVNHNRELDPLSCTDVKQVWGKEKRKVDEVYSAERAVDYWHFQKKSCIEFITNDEVDNANLQMLIKCKPSSAISIFMNNAASAKSQRGPTSENSKDVENPEMKDETEILKVLSLAMNSEFMKNVSIEEEWYPQNTCCGRILSMLTEDDVTKALKSKQGSEEWKQFRKLRITGSSIYSVFTYSKGNWEEKSKSFFWPKGFSNKFVEHGRRYEGNALAAFAIKYPELSLVNTGFIINTKYPWIGYSPDGIIFKGGEPYALLEIKCPFIGKSLPHNDENFIKSCNFLKICENQSMRINENHKYYGQVQLGMALLGLKCAYFIIYSSLSDGFIEIIVEFNNLFSKNLIEVSSEKYLKYMVHQYCINQD